MKTSRDWFSTLAIIGGLLLVLYPTISNFLNLRNATRVIEQYSEAVDELTDDEAAQLMNAARTYNAKLAGLSGIPAADGGWDAIDASTAAQLREEYMGLLDLTGTGVMGYITIPRLDETMPIYHTTEEKVLQVATGHIETSSLPVGGASTHAAISGHRGLPSAKLFTELDKMQLGDIFYVKVLKETFAYQVDQILTVLPEETEALAIEPRADYVTLVTCTPYGINSHRLLVRAHAIPYLPSMEGEVGVMGNPINLSWPHLALIAALILLAVVLAGMRLRRLERRDKDEFLEEGGRAYAASGKGEGHEHAGRHFK